MTTVVSGPAVEFRTKVITQTYTDGSVAFRGVKVPKLTSSHCDMGAFRKHPEWSGYANSDLFPAMLARGLAKLGIGSRIDMGKPLPPGVSVDESGFLALVRIELNGWR